MRQRSQTLSQEQEHIGNVPEGIQILNHNPETFRKDLHAIPVLGSKDGSKGRERNIVQIKRATVVVSSPLFAGLELSFLLWLLYLLLLGGSNKPKVGISIQKTGHGGSYFVFHLW